MSVLLLNHASRGAGVQASGAILRGEHAGVRAPYALRGVQYLATRAGLECG